MKSSENSLSSRIAIGTQGHFSIGHLSKDWDFWGGVYKLAVVADGVINPATGMIIDFILLKRAVSWVLDTGWIEHGFVVPKWLRAVTEKCRSKGLNILSTSDWTLDTLPVTLFDRLLVDVREPAHLRSIILEKIWEKKKIIENKDWMALTKVIKKPKKRTFFEDTIVFAHRIVDLWKCNNPHSHSWNPKILFNRELNPDEYEKITKKIKTYFNENWKWKWIFHETDDVWVFLKEQKAKVKFLPSPPTTEIISMMMIRDLERLIQSESSDIRLAHFELWETPTNFVTT